MSAPKPCLLSTSLLFPGYVALAAFVSFVQAFAVWLYLLCGLGILFAIKMLVDARRLSRTTLFSLEQERASEQMYRAIIVMAVFAVALFFVTTINLVLAPIVPSAGPVILRGATLTLAPLILPTSTSIPTTTLIPPRPTETPFVTGIPVSATVMRTATRAATTSALPATVAIIYALPAPKISGPLPNGGTWIGEGQASAAITFRWSCEQCALGPNDWYEVVITFTDRSGVPRTYAGRTQDKSIALRRIYEWGGFELYQKAKEDTFQWYVQVKREPGNQPLSPPSETWKFVWK